MPQMEEPRPAFGEEREDRHCVHVHVFTTMVFPADGHQHILQGVTAPARPAGRSHIHRIRVRTSYFDDHWHWFDMVTGPTIETLEGGHVHSYGGPTSCDDGHVHDVADTTTLAPDIRLEETFEPPPEPPEPPEPPSPPITGGHKAKGKVVKPTLR